MTDQNDPNSPRRRKHKINSSHPQKQPKAQEKQTMRPKKSLQDNDSRKAKALILKKVFPMDIEDLEELKREYKVTHQGHRASLRKFIADTARWVKAVEEDEEVIKELYDHPFWGNEPPPKAVMQAAMAFLASCNEGKGFKLAQKRARAVEFLIHEGCELDDLEVALKEGLNKICGRAAKEEPRHSKREREEQENAPEGDILDDLDDADDSKSKKRPKRPAKSVILIGKGVIKLLKYPDGKRLKLIVKLEDTDEGTIEVIKVIPLNG